MVYDERGVVVEEDVFKAYTCGSLIGNLPGQ